MSKHVMLSYQWDNQSLVEKVYNTIRAQGIKAWMDIHGGVKGNINERLENVHECGLEKGKDRKGIGWKGYNYDLRDLTDCLCRGAYTCRARDSGETERKIYYSYYCYHFLVWLKESTMLLLCAAL